MKIYYRVSNDKPKRNYDSGFGLRESETEQGPDEIMKMPLPGLQRTCTCGGTCPKCQDAKREHDHLGKNSLNGSFSSAPKIVHDVLKSPGQTLDQSTRSVMEPHFGHDFSKVRVHNGMKAAESADAVNASAYTVGQNVVFNAGQYSPEQSYGQKLLAHELTHVVQQSAAPDHSHDLRIGAPDDHFEKEADDKANQFLKGQSQSKHQRIPNSDSHVLQRQGPGMPSLIPPLHISSEEVTFDQGESITTENPKIVSLANSFKQMLSANPREYIKLSTYLSESSKLSSVKAAEERTQLQRRMITIQTSLIKLGVSAEGVEIESATAFSNKGGGQITASLYKSPRALPPMFGQDPVTGPVSPAATPAATSSLGDMLSFKFNAGPLQFAVEIPKSVAIKLPIAISVAKTLSFELKAESSGDFSFSIALNGSRHLNVAAKAALKVDKDKGTSGSAGIEITTTKTVCNAPSPESLKTKITSAGDKLTKAMKELETAKPDERLTKLTDIAGAIGEMYDAVDKAKSACKEVPRATFNFGIQGPISPTDSAVNDPDPSKRPGSFIGGSITIPF